MIARPKVLTVDGRDDDVGMAYPHGYSRPGYEGIGVKHRFTEAILAAGIECPPRSSRPHVRPVWQAGSAEPSTVFAPEWAITACDVLWSHLVNEEVAALAEERGQSAITGNLLYDKDNALLTRVKARMADLLRGGEDNPQLLAEMAANALRRR